MAATTLRTSNSYLRTSNSYLGAQFRRLKRSLDAPVAIQAMAAKLARLIYRMLRYGMQFVDQGAEVYEAAHRQRGIHYLKQKAASQGFQIIQGCSIPRPKLRIPPQPPSSLSRLSGESETFVICL